MTTYYIQYIDIGLSWKESCEAHALKAPRSQEGTRWMCGKTSAVGRALASSPAPYPARVEAAGGVEKVKLIQ